jgi:hypothetical protein
MSSSYLEIIFSGGLCIREVVAIFFASFLSKKEGGTFSLSFGFRVEGSGF